MLIVVMNNVMVGACKIYMVFLVYYQIGTPLFWLLSYFCHCPAN